MFYSSIFYYVLHSIFFKEQCFYLSLLNQIVNINFNILLLFSITFFLALYYKFFFFFFIFFFLESISEDNFLLTNYLQNSLNLMSLLNGLFVVHPCLVYLAYSSLIFIFSFIYYILIIDLFWISNFIINRIRQYTLKIFFFLGLALSLGSWWAFQEINWGGWWNWDLVELINLFIIILISMLSHSLISLNYKNYIYTFIFFLFFIFFFSQ